MTIREETQAIERQTLSRYATLSQSTRGRRRPEDEDPIRPCYPVFMTGSKLGGGPCLGGVGDIDLPRTGK